MTRPRYGSKPGAYYAAERERLRRIETDDSLPGWVRVLVVGALVVAAGASALILWGAR